MAIQKKRKASNPGRLLHIVILVIFVLVIFEGKMLVSIFTHGGLKSQVDSEVNELFAGAEFQTEAEKTSEKTPEKVSTAKTAKAGTEAQTEAETEPRSPAIVPKQETPVSESYFADATFIGDSRMEGFRQNSGISKGTFLTGVGMTTENIFETPFIATSYGEMITVYQALWNTSCEKFYILLGTNELGTYDWEGFKESYSAIIRELQKMSPDALFYVIGVPYVEEAKVTTGDYVNNANVDTMNDVLIEMCEENGYYFLDINEVLSNGNHALAEGATSDGVHMYSEYCALWLDYLKFHYVAGSVKTGTSGRAMIGLGEGLTLGTGSSTDNTGSTDAVSPQDPEDTDTPDSETDSETESESGSESHSETSA